MATKKQIKDTNVVKTPEVVIQPQFTIPPDIVDVRPADPDEVQFNPAAETFSEYIPPEQGGEIPSTTTKDPATTTVSTDTTTKNVAKLNIVSQKARITADGTTVIDVVLSIDGGPGGIYEWRATVA